MTRVRYKRDMTAREFLAWDAKAVTLLGMSGVGKTTLARRLPTSHWFHFSGDYRIGTRYLDEPILDNIKKEAMKIPFIANLLRTDSIYICHNITVHNLDPVSTFLGMIGDPHLGGLTVQEFKRRQALHKEAELAAMYDVRAFIFKAKDTYEYPYFLNDAGGSLCELGDNELYRRLAEDTVIIYLKPSDDTLKKIVDRSLRHPKPMYYQDRFLDAHLSAYLKDRHLHSVEQIIPNDFYEWVFPRLVQHRLPLYEQLAEEYGVVADADRIDEIDSESDFLEWVSDALDRREKSGAGVSGRSHGS